jgi:hypothetical protein
MQVKKIMSMLLISLRLTMNRETRTITKNDTTKPLMSISPSHIEIHNAKNFIEKKRLTFNNPLSLQNVPKQQRFVNSL